MSHTKDRRTRHRQTANSCFPLNSVTSARRWWSVIRLRSSPAQCNRRGGDAATRLTIFCRFSFRTTRPWRVSTADPVHRNWQRDRLRRHVVFADNLRPGEGQRCAQPADHTRRRFVHWRSVCSSERLVYGTNESQLYSSVSLPARPAAADAVEKNERPLWSMTMCVVCDCRTVELLISHGARHHAVKIRLNCRTAVSAIVNTFRRSDSVGRWSCPGCHKQVRQGGLTS
jgi:hypothetical protein